MNKLEVWNNKSDANVEFKAANIISNCCRMADDLMHISAQENKTHLK